MDELRAQGYHFKVKTVTESLRRHGLRAKLPGISVGLLPRTQPACVRKSAGAGFLRQWLNQKWAGDITYLRTDEGWPYLAVVTCHYWLINVVTHDGTGAPERYATACHLQK